LFEQSFAVIKPNISNHLIRTVQQNYNKRELRYCAVVLDKKAIEVNTAVIKHFMMYIPYISLKVCDIHRTPTHGMSVKLRRYL